mgnify:CR=1 FL=1
MNIIKRTLVVWVPLAILASMVAFTGYTLVQQSQRSAASDPQIQMVEDAAAALNAGADPAKVVGASIDAAASLAPFVIVYNENHIPVASGAVLSGKAPVPPAGVFDYVSGHSRDGKVWSLREQGDTPGEERFSWEPQSGVRFATVVVGYKNGFVLAARNLREVERRERYTFEVSVFAYLLGLALTFIWSLGVAILTKRD